MRIERALQLEKGDVVVCPPDRGDPGFRGKVINSCKATKTISKTILGEEFIWVEVQGPSHKSMWPSNRLG